MTNAKYTYMINDKKTDLWTSIQNVGLSQMCFGEKNTKHVFTLNLNVCENSCCGLHYFIIAYNKFHCINQLNLINHLVHTW